VGFDGVKTTLSRPVKVLRSTSTGFAPGSRFTVKLVTSTPRRLPTMRSCTVPLVSVAAYTYATSKVTPLLLAISAGRPPWLMAMPSGDTTAGRYTTLPVPAALAAMNWPTDPPNDTPVAPP